MFDSDNFIVIQGWMCNELKLKGNDLLVFALIYGFSQDGESSFTGSRKYIADLFNISLPTVDKSLDTLVEKNLIEKFSTKRNNIIFNHYKISLQVVKKLYRGSKETLHNNIKDNIDNLGVNIGIFTPEDSGGEPKTGKNFNLGVKKKSKEETKQKSLYEKCIDVNNSFTDDEDLRQALRNYLQFRMHIPDSRLYFKNWEGLIKTKLASFPEEDRLDVVNQAIELGYLSFYAVKDRWKRRGRVSEPINADCSTSTEDENRKHSEFIENMRRQGKRTEF